MWKDDKTVVQCQQCYQAFSVARRKVCTRKSFWMFSFDSDYSCVCSLAIIEKLLLIISFRHFSTIVAAVVEYFAMAALITQCLYHHQPSQSEFVIHVTTNFLQDTKLIELILFIYQFLPFPLHSSDPFNPFVLLYSFI